MKAFLPIEYGLCKGERKGEVLVRGGFGEGERCVTRNNGKL